MEVAKDGETVVHRHDHGIAAARERLAVDPRPAAALLGEAAAVTPEHHRPSSPITDARRPYVQIEAVLVEPFCGIRLRREHLREPHVLRRLMPVTYGLADTRPRSGLGR